MSEQIFTQPLDIPLHIGDDIRTIHVEPGEAVVIELHDEHTNEEITGLALWWQDHLPTVPMTCFNHSGDHLLVVPDDQLPYPLECDTCRKQIPMRPSERERQAYNQGLAKGIDVALPDISTT